MSWRISKYSIHLLIALMLFTTTSCGIYSFTGVAITAETLSISTFYNDAEGGPPDLAQTFTNELRDYYLQNTNLTLVKENGELLVEGAVVGYRLSPVAPVVGGNNQADLSDVTRLTITVNVSYTNTKDDTFNFENKKFSFFSDYNSSENLTTIENRLIDEIYDQIVLDVFNQTVANW